MAEPAYKRLPVDERRQHLLDKGTELFARRSYDELSMAGIAREAGISKALLYHYFPSKKAYFAATLAQAAEQLAERTTPDPALPPLEALTGSLEAFLLWIEENELAYTKLMEGATGSEEVRALVAEVRDQTAERILDGLLTDPTPKARTAVRGWLWFTDGAILDWLEHRDLERTELRDFLVGALLGALRAAGAEPSP